MARQVKSRQRVTNHGEVFTGEREVKAMCDLVENECVRIDSRFLEPACGDGNFLAEILTRKLAVVTKKYKKNSYDWECNSIMALGSLYGVELLMDNVLACRERLYKLWEEHYVAAVRKKEIKEDVKESARYIIGKNIICGNALTLRCVDENGEDTPVPIIFSQWSFVTRGMVKREDYIFEQMVNGDDSEKKKSESKEQSLDFGDNHTDEDEGTLVKVYKPINYRRISTYG